MTVERSHRRLQMKKAVIFFSFCLLFSTQGFAQCYLTRNVKGMDVDCNKEASVDSDKVCRGEVLGWERKGNCKNPLSRYKAEKFTSSCGPTSAYGQTFMFSGKITCIEE